MHASRSQLYMPEAHLRKPSGSRFAFDSFPPIPPLNLNRSIPTHESHFHRISRALFIDSAEPSRIGNLYHHSFMDIRIPSLLQYPRNAIYSILDSPCVLDSAPFLPYAIVSIGRGRDTTPLFHGSDDYPRP